MVKSLESHRVRTVLTNRTRLVGIRQDLEHQVRSVLKTFGFVLGKGSGETDRAGRISKCGDGPVRTYLVEAAGVLLTRSKAPSDLKDWASGWPSGPPRPRRRLASPASSR
jgi:transposase